MVLFGFVPLMSVCYHCFTSTPCIFLDHPCLIMRGFPSSRLNHFFHAALRHFPCHFFLPALALLPLPCPLDRLTTLLSFVCTPQAPHSRVSGQNETMETNETNATEYFWQLVSS
jgi:hypothetical protein